MEQYFPIDYEQSRAVFRSHLKKVQKKWPDATLFARSIGKDADNTIDGIWAEATERNEKVLFLSAGEHGIEGYAGAAAIHLFVDEYIEQLDPRTTGICLIHALNPWGMRHFRRVTENNVDLNRNYVYNRSVMPDDINKNYENAEDLFVPVSSIRDLTKEKAGLYAILMKDLAKEGYGGLQEAKKMGQYEFPKGVYYGGQAAEESAIFLKQIQQDLLGGYRQIVHMDWHTALGPINELTVVLPAKDGRDPETIKQQYGLKHVIQSSADQVKGDSHDHFYLVQEDYPDTYLFSALFEFGTFGEGKRAELRELMAIVFENQMYWEGAQKPEDRRYILEEVQAMFYPVEKEWREELIKEARRGLEGVLKAERFI
ncbi:M14 family metallopeptidase [Lentibacillus sediminis]|uniref:M14 family metallopeptidase n=1 Tax=Lentibacillus sediminis TaxID=1940529 RepID=UPI000C1BA779|nr:M14 family metallopeptidase [Lentibacillus sediminis]